MLKLGRVVAVVIAGVLLAGCPQNVFRALQEQCRDAGHNVIKGNGEWHCEDDAGNVVTF